MRFPTTRFTELRFQICFEPKAYGVKCCKRIADRLLLKSSGSSEGFITAHMLLKLTRHTQALHGAFWEKKSSIYLLCNLWRLTAAKASGAFDVAQSSGNESIWCSHLNVIQTQMLFTNDENYHGLLAQQYCR